MSRRDEYFACLADTTVVLRYLMDVLGLGRFGRRELQVLIREAALELQRSRQKRNVRIVK